jgi:acetyl esterase/lipase/sugar lactone lactonase YvrE
MGDGGPAIRARLVTPVGLARDAQGNLYISERGAHRIRRVDARTGIITTYAGTGEQGFSGDGGPATRATLTQPDEIIVDRDGNLIFGDVFNHRVRKVDARTGVITTIAGTGQRGFSGDGGPATQARLDGPFGVALDTKGNLYIADTENQRIRRVDAVTGIITTIAGNGVWDYAGDGGPAPLASFARPHRIVIEGDTALLIGDTFNLRIRRVDLRTGIIQNIAGTGERGSGGDGGRALDAAFTYFGSLAFAPDGDLIVPSLAEQRIRRIDSQTGIVSTIAGNGTWAFSGDGGPATSASLHLPLSVVIDLDGSILFTDMWNGRVRRIDGRTGLITTVVGSAPSPETPAVSWHFHYNRDSVSTVLDQPVRYAIDGMQQVGVIRNVAYRSDEHRHARLDAYIPMSRAPDGRRPFVVVVPARNDVEVRLKDSEGFASWGRLIAASGMVAVLIDHSLGTRARALPEAASDIARAIEYVEHHAGELQVDASRFCVLSFSSGSALAAAILEAGGAALRCVGAYYPHVDLTRDDITPWWTNVWLQEPREARERYSLARVLPASRIPALLVRAGGEQGTLASMLDSLRISLAARRGVTFLEHADGSSGFERTIDDAITRDVVRGTLCFLQLRLEVEDTQCGAGDAGPATAAFLDRPMSVALDAEGNLYVSEQRAHRVRRVDAETGVITTVVGTGAAGSSGDGGPARRAQVNYPKVAIDAAGNIYIGEVDGYRIRRIDARTGVITTVAGTGVQGFSGDGGPASAAQITRPFGLAFDGEGDLYFTDTEANRIRRIDRASGNITTVAGNGRYGFSGDGGAATAASLARPHVLTFDPQGNLVIGDSFNQRIRRVDRRTGIISTIAGSGFRGNSGDNGHALEATFVYFGGIAYDTAGDLLVSGVGDHHIRRIERSTGVIRAFAGTGRFTSDGDGGPALAASFHPALELAVDARNNVYVADAYGGRVRRIDGTSGIVGTVAGNRPPAARPGDFHVHFDSTEVARLLDTPVALSVEGIDGVRVTRDLDYTGTGDVRRRMDIYLPARAAAAARAPIVLLVHGSAGTDLRQPAKDWGAWTSRGQLLGAHGLAGVTFTHRLNQEGGLETAAQDLVAAIDYLRANAEVLQVDGGRICVVTFEEGATLIAELLRSRRPELRCVAAFTPVLDLRGSPPPFWMETTASVRDRYSPAALIEAGAETPPMLLLVGARDSEQVTATARRLAAFGRDRQIPIELLEHPTGGATFDRGAPGPLTEEMLRRWIAFLHSHLR